MKQLVTPRVAEVAGQEARSPLVADPDSRFYSALGTLAHDGIEDHLAAYRVRAQIARLARDP